MNKGKIIRIISNLYSVLVNDTIIEARARGKFRKDEISPMVGDEVIIDIEKKYIIEILPRKNYLTRPNISNIDLVICVTSTKEPDLSLNLLDKQLAFLALHNIPSMICFTKYDLLNDSEKEEINNLKEYYQSIGITVVINSEITKIKEILKGKEVGLLGQSGAGKSSLVNKLGNYDIKTQKISKALGRGIHTTRHVEIYKVSDFYLIDTPGFSALDLNFTTKDNLKNGFIEFQNYECRFKDCKHYKEIDCGIKEEVGKSILPSRYENYINFLEKEQWK
ncbi:putative ribosome biogenesis GTPase RsgA [Mycoplasma sp. CAG:956]|nr:putative ribosome biogenesis GTPase RsgA [Mycoplasma sp. CAG:956]